MAVSSTAFNTTKTWIVDQTLDVKNDTLKVMWICDDVAYTPDATMSYVDEGGAADPIDCEPASLTNYAGGWGGSGRKTLSSVTVTTNQTSGRCEIDAADVTWTTLGGAANATLKGFIIIKEGASDDTTSITLWFIVITDLTTNGSDVQIVWNSAGFVHLTTFGFFMNPLEAFRGLWHKIVSERWSRYSEKLTPEKVEKIRKRTFKIVKPRIYRFIDPVRMQTSIQPPGA